MTVMPLYQFDVQVTPQYRPDESDTPHGLYVFAYTVVIQNTGSVAAQLISRHWVIVDANGHTEEVKGLAVIGHQPLLAPGESFQYSSGCRLQTPTGTMHGSYFCVADDGERFDVEIPMFVLEADGLGLPKRVLH